MHGTGNVAYVDNPCNNGRTPISWAGKGHDQVVRLFIKHGASLDSRDARGVSPLSWAALGGHELVVLRLFERVAKLELELQKAKYPHMESP
jgi:ankyrin repeat protein